MEAGALWATSQFYKLAKVLFAPNDELCRMLERTTGRPCFLMQRGVDTEWFSPAHRTREADEERWCWGMWGGFRWRRMWRCWRGWSESWRRWAWVECGF